MRVSSTCVALVSSTRRACLVGRAQGTAVGEASVGQPFRLARAGLPRTLPGDGVASAASLGGMAVRRGNSGWVGLGAQVVRSLSARPDSGRRLRPPAHRRDIQRRRHGGAPPPLYSFAILHILGANELRLFGFVVEDEGRHGWAIPLLRDTLRAGDPARAAARVIEGERAKGVERKGAPGGGA